MEAEVRTCNKTGDFFERLFGVYGFNKKANKCHFNLPSKHTHTNRFSKIQHRKKNIVLVVNAISWSSRFCDL